MTMSFREVLSALPKDTFAKSPARAWGALGLDVLLFLLFATVIVQVHQLVLGGLLGVTGLGLVLTGFFVIGHDAGHRSFSDSERVNNLIGHLATSCLGWPFHLWRLAHNVHHQHTNHVTQDIAWEPHTREQISQFPRVFRQGYSIARSRWWAFWAASLFHNLHLWMLFFSGSFYKAEDRRKIGLSIVFSLVGTTAYAMTAYWVAGGYGVLTLFALPMAGFYFWLTTFTLLHHTHPELRFLNDAAWNKVRGQLDGTVNVRYGAVVDFFTHNIAWHTPHHVSVGIPFYRLKSAHYALKAAFPDRIRELPFTLTHLLAVLDTCQAVDNHHDANWLPFVDAPVAVTMAVPD